MTFNGYSVHLKLLLILVFGLNLCAAQPAADPDPITNAERVGWVTYSTIGPPNLAAGLFTAGWGTLRGNPKEYDTHWKGFGQRYALRTEGIATSNVMEAGIGMLWGEDPRYRREGSGGMKHRIIYAAKTAFTARNRAGETVPAYARYIAIPGSNFLSNTWRPDSQATVSQAMIRTGLGFTGRVVSDMFWEFWPDIKSMSFHNK